MTAVPDHADHVGDTAVPPPDTTQLPRRIPGHRLRVLMATPDVDWFGPADPDWPTADDLDKAEKARMQAAVNDVPVTSPDELAVDDQFADRLIAGIRRLSSRPAPATRQPDTEDAP